MNIISQIKEIFNKLLVKQYSYYDKLIHAGLDEGTAADIYSLCEDVRASGQLKIALAQSIMCGYVGGDEATVIFEESPPQMFSDNKRKLVSFYLCESIRGKRMPIDEFISLLDI